jgi:hypothetical protein
LPFHAAGAPREQQTAEDHDHDRDGEKTGQPDFHARNIARSGWPEKAS